MAGLWSAGRSPTGEKVPTCTVITTEANERIASIHDRMPVILPERHWPAWLGEVSATPEELRAMLVPLPSEEIEMWPVDRRVGNVNNEGADLALPVPLLI
jgi:putative SOS response-associated peptidase YedK